MKCHGSTLLPQFLGMYRVSVDNEETYLIVMRNMFSHRLVVHRKYDLKVRRNSTADFSPLVLTQSYRLYDLFFNIYFILLKTTNSNNTKTISLNENEQKEEKYIFF